jgi:hypothetical protein
MRSKTHIRAGALPAVHKVNDVTLKRGVIG